MTTHLLQCLTLGLHELYQPTYTFYHSTETALLRAQNDIFRAIDNKETSSVSLLTCQQPSTRSTMKYYCHAYPAGLNTLEVPWTGLAPTCVVTVSSFASIIQDPLPGG